MAHAASQSVAVGSRHTAAGFHGHVAFQHQASLVAVFTATYVFLLLAERARLFARVWTLHFCAPFWRLCCFKTPLRVAATALDRPDFFQPVYVAPAPAALFQVQPCEPPARVEPRRGF